MIIYSSQGHMHPSALSSHSIHPLSHRLPLVPRQKVHTWLSQFEMTMLYGALRVLEYQGAGWRSDQRKMLAVHYLHAVLKCENINLSEIEQSIHTARSPKNSPARSHSDGLSFSDRILSCFSMSVSSSTIE